MTDNGTKSDIIQNSNEQDILSPRGAVEKPIMMTAHIDRIEMTLSLGFIQSRYEEAVNVAMYGNISCLAS